MIGPVATLALLIGLGQVSPSLQLRAETGGGEAPVIIGQPSEMGVSAVIEPQGQVRIGGAENHATGRYTPRVSWRRPNAIKADRPLLLHTVELGTDLRPAARMTVRASSRLSVGEPDYTALQSLFGQSQGALPEVDEILDVRLGLETGVLLDRRNTIGAQADFGHRQPLGDVDTGQGVIGAPAAPGDPVPFVVLGNQTAISGGPFFAHRLTLIDTLLLAADMTYETRDPNIQFWITFASLGWERKLTPTQTLSLAGGVAYAKVKGATLQSDANASDTSMTPVASVGYLRQIARGAESALAVRANLSVMNVVDPVLNVAGPRARLEIGFDKGVAPRWVCTGTGSFSTNLSHHERAMLAVFPPDETLAAFALVFRHRPSPLVALDVGMRWSDRAPNLRADDVDWHQRELWGFVSATFSVRPARP